MLYDENMSLNSEIEYRNQQGNIDYFKHQLELVKKSIEKTREKLMYSRKVYHQFAMLANKTVNENYGTIERPIKTETMPLLELPETHEESKKEIMHLINTTASSDVMRFIMDTPVVERLMFTHLTIFDDTMLDVLQRTSPDIRVAFFTSVLQKLQKCSSILDPLIPVLAKIALHPSLTEQLTDPSARIETFHKFYKESLSNIASLINFSNIKILYNVYDGEHLIYPTDSYSHMIPIKDTLLGSLLEFKNPQKIKSPLIDPRLKRPYERCVFDTDEIVMSIRFSYGNLMKHGLLLVFSETDFNESDETTVSLVAEYMSPALHLMSDVFNKVTPSDFSCVTSYLSKLYVSYNPIATFAQHLAEITHSSQYRTFLLKEDVKELDTIRILPKEKSIIRTVAEQKVAKCIKEPRFRSDFNTEIDNCVLLPRINAMLIIPIDAHGIVVVLYNSTIMNFYTPKSIELCVNYAKGVSVAINQHVDRLVLCNRERQYNTELATYHRFFTTFHLLVEAALDDSLVEQAEYMLDNKECRIEVLTLYDDDQMYVFTQSTFQAIPEHFKAITEAKLFKASDKEVIYVIPSVDKTTLCCIYGPSNYFTEKQLIYLKMLGSAVLMLYPWQSLRIQVNELKIREYLFSNMLSTDYLGLLLDRNIQLKVFDKPQTLDVKTDDSSNMFHIKTEEGVIATLSVDDTCTDEIRSALLAYSGWIKVLLKYQNKSIEISPDLQKLFIDNDVLEVFCIDEDTFIQWLSNIIRMCTSNNVNIDTNFKKIEYLLHVITSSTFKEWYSRDEILILIMITFLRGMEKYWQFPSDDITRQLAILTGENAAPLIGMLFNKIFGLGKNLPFESMERLCTYVNTYTIGSKIADETEVVANVKISFDQNFNENDYNKKWVGRSLVLLSELYRLDTKDRNTIKQIKNNNLETKLLICKFEKILIQIASFLSRRNQFLLNVQMNCRAALRILKGFDEG